ncbi:MAG: hypothetical protein IKP28_03955 [Clostridia bacterium]|nr:hypothetical protein [Clostridia bacterium]
MEKHKRGITLIALVITVIVIITIAGATITIGLNNGELFERSDNAVRKWNAKAEEEKLTLSDYMEYFEANPQRLIITPRQVGAKVEFTVDGLETKNIAEATREEKLEVLLTCAIADGAPPDLTIENIKDALGAYNYEELIAMYLEHYEITVSDGAEENDILDAILAAAIAEGAPSNLTRADIKSGIEAEVAEGDERIAEMLEEYEVTYIEETLQIVVTYGDQTISTLNAPFIARQEGTYNIVATTSKGRNAEASIIVDFHGLTPLIIGNFPILYNSNTITTWADLIESEYNTLGLNVNMNNDVYALSEIVGRACYIEREDGLCAKLNQEIDPQYTYRFFERIV